jgi:hypothetical protein
MTSREWPDAQPKPLTPVAQAARRIGTGESAAAGPADAPPGPPVVPGPESPSDAAYERLARVLAEALAAWWRRAHPNDPDLAR